MQRLSVPSTLAVFAALALSALALPTAARAQVDTNPRPGVSVRLNYDAGTRPGVIVLPVRGAGGDSIRAIIQRDLDYGDRVNVVTGSAADAPMTDGRINYALAAKLGAAAVVQGTLTNAGALHVAVHDVARQQVLTVRDFPLGAFAASAAWRLSVHAVSDQIEQWLTGVRGIAATRLAFERDGRVWIVDSDGEYARPISERGALSPAWHPSGTAVVYGTLDDAGRQRIVAQSLDGGARVLASSPVTNLTPTVSPDGQTVVYAHGEEAGVDLYAVPFGGGSPRRLTVGRGSINVSPTFSPDGRRVAFTSGRSGHPEVYITDADGADVDLLTSYDFGDQNYRSDPDWSPDGRLVAFQSMIGGVFQVFTISLRDRSVKRLTTEARNEAPSWAPDSRHVVIMSTRTGSRQLFVLDTETGRARQLTRGASTRMPAWSPPLVRAP
ncbi:WD40-like beta Propeller containing protein [Gemmatirosa kalamazoonensis]|uniref:WD40-like beta Propeller containing protein n=1 Tax=Gemmatirosa kalamazoonensis TaxID=861299 RepID=W0RNQ2_9BACT|nr:PD40 domain-containing protein [Gemmatirosa kalamazoonensis]AHG91088.1 WD40-like beta Propeller containing protein [Gemmatirosa kalamazoonensis]